MPTIYISSSWKNRTRVREIATLLRANGLEVYDFTDPKCRKMPEIPPEAFPEYPNGAKPSTRTEKHCHADWGVAIGAGKPSIWVIRKQVREHHRICQFDPLKHQYRSYLDAVACDVCVLLLPCGTDSGLMQSFLTITTTCCEP